MGFFAKHKVRPYLLDPVTIVRINRTSLNKLCEGGTHEENGYQNRHAHGAMIQHVRRMMVAIPVLDKRDYR